MHAQFIENFELREWVKKSLRKTIFLKAHELATQTGCEVLLKIRDEVDQAGSLYYATDTLQKEYSDKGLLKGPNEMCVSGETGMPMYPRVDTATQSVQCGQQQVGVGNIDSSTPEQDTSSIPLHLTVSNASLQQTEDSSSQEATPVDQSIVKLEVIEEPEAEMETSLTVSDMIGDQTIGETSLTVSDMIGDQTIEQAADETLASFGIPVNVSSLSTMPGGFPVASSSPKLYQCAVCQKAFRSVQVLQKHTQTFHIKTTPMSAMSRMKGRGPSMRPASAGRPLAQKRYTCTLCNRSFPFVALYNDHMNRSHMMSSTQYPQESQIVEQFDTSNNDNANMDTSGEGTSSAPPQMPTISQVMSLQPSVLLQSPPAASSSHVPFTLAVPSTPVFTHTPGPSTSGAGMSSHQRAGTNRSTPSSRATPKHPIVFKNKAASEVLAWREVKLQFGKGYIVGEFIYTKMRKNTEGVLYLRCRQYKKTRNSDECRGHAVIAADGIARATQQHSHPPPDLSRLHVDKIWNKQKPFFSSRDSSN